MTFWLTFALLAVGTIPALAQQQASVLKGSVTDLDGRPLRDVDLAQFWLAGSDSPGGTRAIAATQSDQRGQFELKISQASYPITVFAMDSVRRMGAVTTIPDADAARHIAVPLQLLRSVHYLFNASGTKSLSGSRVMLQTASGQMFGQIIGELNGTILLPPGRYSLAINAPDGTKTNIGFEVADRDITLKSVDLPANIAQHYGLPSPSLMDVDVVNGRPFNIQSLKGKWVLVYFWGYWCAPCINEGIPKLVRFYRQNNNRLNEFEILAIHENGVAGNITADELRQKLAALTKDKWSDEPLPFPVLLDRSGKTIKSWGISAYPTVALITPQGQLRQGDLDALRNVLKLQ